MPWRFAYVLLLIGPPALWAQDQPPTTAAGAAHAAPAPQVLQNSGKPMRLPFQCTEEDMQWAGMSCSEDAPCPIFLEVTATGSENDHFLAVGNIHSADVTLYSVLLASDDAGLTWHEAHPRIRGAGLDRLDFVDAQTGWAAGQLLSPLPREPFVLLTTDGGKSWRQQNIFREDADNLFGSIIEFHFASRMDGSLIIDRGLGGDPGRYARYESLDGGETWQIKEESATPLHLKLLPAGPAEWRVRADGPSQAFILERRLGDRWIDRAAFAVKIGACKPPEQ